MDIKSKIQDVKGLFERHEDWEDRYRELMVLGKKLPPFPEPLREEKYQVKGCQSQVWLVPRFEQDRLYFEGESDALIVKGILALLIKVYSGETPQSILQEKSDFLQEMGITEHLSMNRSNGLASILKQIRLYAVAYQTLKDHS